MSDDTEGILEIFEGTDSDLIGFGNTGSGHYFLTKEDFEKYSDKYSGCRSVQCVKLNGKYYELKSIIPLRIRHDEECKQERFKRITKDMSLDDISFITDYIADGHVHK